MDSIPPVKVVVSGPVGAGKTSLIQHLSESPVVDTDALATEDIGKEKTTVAMDFGSFTLDDIPVHMFGTPGQDRFDYMWEILCEGSLGLILLVAGHKPEDFAHAKHILEFITSRISIPFIVGVTHQDREHVWRPEDVAAYFDLPNDLVIGLTATRTTDSVLALIHLLQVIQDSEVISEKTEPDYLDNDDFFDDIEEESAFDLELSSLNS